MQEETHLCAYCGAPATHQLKNGKWCCHPSFNQCPSVKAKNAAGLKRAHSRGCYDNWHTQLKVGQAHPWNKGKTAELDERVAKRAKKVSDGYKSGRLIPSFKGKHHTSETRRKQRLALHRVILASGRKNKANFSIKGCAYIDQLNESKGWHLQHALNGGEVCVSGYFLDGYDKELNIAFEYDEPAHYTEQGELRERDVFRMNYIHQKLGCRFFRYNEARKLLYEVQF